MPEASWCRSCSDYVWVASDGGCSNGHPRSDLQAIYEAPAAAGMFVPPPPRRPDGRPPDDWPQIDLLPQPTYGRAGRVNPAQEGEYRSSGSRRGAQIAVILGVLTLAVLVALSARGHSPGTTNALGTAPVQSTGQLVIQDHKVLEDADGRPYVTGAVLNRSKRSLDRVHVTLTLYDQAGSEVGEISTDLSHLGPGESGRFEIPVNVANVGRFRVTAVSDP